MAIDLSGLPDQGTATATPAIDLSGLPDQGQPAGTATVGPLEDVQGAPQDPVLPQIQAMSPEDMSRTGQLGYEPSTVTAGTEPTKISEALRANVQPMLEHPVDSFTGMFTNWDDLKRLYDQPQDILGPTAKRFAGMQVSPEEEIGSQNFYNTGVGAALVGAGALHGIGEKPAVPIEDIKASLETPEAPVNAPESPVASSDAENAPTEPKVESQAERYQQFEPNEQELAKANEQTGSEPAPAPEEATDEAPNVREALSLDELRLMRERNDLQLQNDLAKRATGNTHPAIDERIGQINDELDNIANQHLDTAQAVPEGAFDTLREPLKTPEIPPEASAPQRQSQPPQSPKPQSAPTPDRQQLIQRGMNGAVRVVFPDALHKELFAFAGRLKRAAMGDKSYDMTALRQRLSAKLGIQDGKVGAISGDYRRQISEAIKPLREGETFTAPRFDGVDIPNETPQLAVESQNAATTRPDQGGVQAGESQAGQPDAAQVQPASVGQPRATSAIGETGQTAGTSNRQNVETYGEDAVPSGTGVDTTELLDNARADIRSGATDPYAVLSRTRGNGIANAQEYATLAAEHERLVNEAVAKQKAGDPTAPQAVQAAEDFANAIQPHKTAASDVFRLMQGDLNYDLGTPFGMNEYMKAELGRGMKPSETPRFTRMANDIGRAEGEVPKAVERSDARVRSNPRYAKVADIPIEDAAARVKEFLKDCVV